MGRVQRVAQAVGQRVESEKEERDHDARRNAIPGRSAQVAAALREAEAALTISSASDAATALARACSKLAELELLNGGVWPPDSCPLAFYDEGPTRNMAEAVGSAAGDVGALGLVHTELSAVFRRYLPAAAACVFDFLIKNGGSAALASVINAFDFAGIRDLDLVFAALGKYGLVKIGREERALPGLPGSAYEEPVLTLP